MDATNVRSSDRKVATSSEDTDGILKTAARGNLPGPLAGRLAVWIIEEALRSLVPSHVPWPGKTRVQSYPQDPRGLSVQHESLFPFGPLGVETWRSDFRSARSTIDLLSGFSRDFFLDDVANFLKAAGPHYRPWGRHSYEKWWSDADQTISDVARHDRRLAGLVILREASTFPARLPHLRWLVLLASMLALVGIFIPLVVSSLRLEEASPPSVNVALTLASFVFAISAGALLWFDLSRPPEREFLALRYLRPLREQLTVATTRGRSLVSVGGLDLVSQATQSAGALLPAKGRALLIECEEALRTSNRASETMASVVATELLASEILKRYAADPMSGGRSLQVLELLDDGLRAQRLQEITPGQRAIVHDERGPRVTTDLLKIRIDSVEAAESVRAEFDRVYGLCRAKREHTVYEAARRRMEEACARLLEWLETPAAQN
jgi:hypothetical protein